MSRSRGKGYRWYVPPIPHYAQTATESCAHRHDIQPHGEYRFWNRCCREPVHALRLSRNIPVTRRRSASPSSHLISYIYLFFLLGLPPLQSHTQRLGQHRKLLIQGEFVNLAEYVSSFSQLLRISSFEWTLAAIGSRATTRRLMRSHFGPSVWERIKTVDQIGSPRRGPNPTPLQYSPHYSPQQFPTDMAGLHSSSQTCQLARILRLLLDLNVWTSSTVTNATPDASGSKWTVAIERPDGERVFKEVKHVVFAAGLG
jgi:hypothetical protein